MKFILKLFIIFLLGISGYVQFTSASCNIATEITKVELENIKNLLNETTAININSAKVLNDIVPLLIQFRNIIGDAITDFLTLHEDASLSELLDAIKSSVADNIAIMEKEVPFDRFEKFITLYHDQLYRTIQDEMNCRTNAYEDFKSRRSDVQETCFYNRFGPAFNKLTKETQSFIVDFLKFLRDGQSNTIAEFKVQIAKWSTDIPNALNCGVPGCIANYVAANKDNILKDINIGHNIKDRTKTYIASKIFYNKLEFAKSMISNEFIAIYDGIKECYKY